MYHFIKTFLERETKNSHQDYQHLYLLISNYISQISVWVVQTTMNLGIIFIAVNETIWLIKQRLKNNLNIIKPKITNWLNNLSNK